MLNFIVVLDENELLFYDVNTGVIVSSISALEDTTHKGLWSIGGAASACGLWAGDSMWVVGFQSPTSYADKLDPTKLTLAQRLQSCKITAKEIRTPF